MVAKVVKKKVETVRDRGVIHKAIVYMVLLYGSKRWVVTGDMLKVLEGFHHWEAKRIAGKTDQHTMVGEWGWSSVERARYRMDLVNLGIHTEESCHQCSAGGLPAHI